MQPPTGPAANPPPPSLAKAQGPEPHRDIEAQTPDASEQRARSVLTGYHAFAVSVLCLSTINMYWRLNDSTPGDPFQHFLAWIFASVEVSVLLFSAIARWKPIQELELHCAMVFYMCVCFPIYSILSPYTTQHDVAFGVAAIAMTSLMYMAVVIYTSAELGPTRMKLKYIYPALCAAQVASCLRRSGESVPELPFACFTVSILMAAIIHAGEHIEANIVRMRHSLNLEVRRAESALASSQRSKADLENLSHGMGRMLKALCDIVVYLKSDLCITNPSGQLLEFLTGQHGTTVASLEGRSILDFMQTDQDRRLVQSFLTPKAADCTGEHSDCGAAGSFNVCVRDESGGTSRVQIFYARLAAGNFLLGFRIDHDLSKTLSDEENELLLEEIREREAALGFPEGPAREGQQLQQPQLGAAPSERSGGAVSEAESPVFLDALEPDEPSDRQPGRQQEEPRQGPDSNLSQENLKQKDQLQHQLFKTGRNPSRIAVRFDASSEDFGVGGQNPLVNSPQMLRMRPQALLNWVAHESQEAFEDWVVRSVQHAPWDKTAISEPFGGPLTLTLPKVRARTVSVSQAWLETSPPDEYGDIWATLWLEGFENENRAKRSRSSLSGRHPLATVQEETVTDVDLDDDQSSDASSSLGSSTTRGL